MYNVFKKFWGEIPTRSNEPTQVSNLGTGTFQGFFAQSYLSKILYHTYSIIYYGSALVSMRIRTQHFRAIRIEFLH
jgi:hypothetical protein